MIHAALALRRLRDRRLLAAVLALCAVGVVLAAVPHNASANLLTPENGAGSREADDIATLYKITAWMGVPIFLGVEGVLIYSLIKHRARRGAAQPAQVRGHTRLETSWTVAAALLLVVIAAITFVFLPGIRTPQRGGIQQASAVQVAATGQPPVPGGPSMHIRVVGQQYIWRYDYPGPGRLFSYYRMVVPTNTTITLDITSSDVIHSFWIPKLFGMADAVPGYHNYMWFKVAKEGVYRGNCTQLCGENHAQMIGEVKAVSPEAFRVWEARQSADIAASQRDLAAQRRRLGVGVPGAVSSQVPQ
jgi:cytochrome c oxidase subunit 2